MGDMWINTLVGNGRMAISLNSGQKIIVSHSRNYGGILTKVSNVTGVGN